METTNEVIIEKYGKKFLIRDTKADRWLIDKEMKDHLKVCRFNKDDMWLDLGAHIGIFGVICFDKVKKVIGVEPLEDNIKMIEKQKQTSGMDNYEIIKGVVIHDDTQYVDLFVNETDSCNSIVKKRRKNKDIIKVKCHNIDKLVEETGANKIKMDIEGAEYEIIKSMNFDPIDELRLEWHTAIVDDKNRKYTDEDSMYREIVDILKTKFKTVLYPNAQWNASANITCYK